MIFKKKWVKNENKIKTFQLEFSNIKTHITYLYICLSLRGTAYDSTDRIHLLSLSLLLSDLKATYRNTNIFHAGYSPVLSARHFTQWQVTSQYRSTEQQHERKSHGHTDKTRFLWFREPSIYSSHTHTYIYIYKKFHICRLLTVFILKLSPQFLNRLQQFLRTTYI
jgi:hypothetical protein